ncbi:hypothetical protein PanWU01x14_312920 [Parasponia andersonii]|uniref:Uncharacterized protein n=1 Tax=Parasponia andersonii TaxID=3476 RepID=A0A2P5APD1_PARAD|nr:hypothetical protein PanWU01x14_312920 [Parasponia andersonii]
MNQQIRGANTLSPGDLHMKRKRGRPRKDKSLVQGESTNTVPVSDSSKKTKQSVASGDGADKMVGQVVSGVIDGSFDAGYLLNVKVGDTDTQLRGLVFLPGRFTPITAANDVAPHVRMYKRKEIPIPTLNEQSQPHNPLGPEKSEKQPAKPNNQASTFTDQSQPSQSRPGISVAEHWSSAVMIPLADSIPEKDSGLSLSRKVIPPRINEVPSSVMAQMESDKVVEGRELLQETEDSTLIKGPNEVETNEKSKAEAASDPAVDKLLRIEASKLMKGPNDVQVNETSKSEPASEPFVDSVPDIEAFKLMKGPNEVQVKENSKSKLASETVIDSLPDVEASKLMKGPNEVEANGISQAEPAPAPVSEILAGIETSMPVEGPNHEEANKESKEEPAPPPVIDIFQGIEAGAKEPEIQHQALSSNPGNDLVHDEVKTPNLELNQPPPPVVAESELMNSAPHCKSVNNSMEIQGNGEGALQETHSVHAIEVSSREGKPEGDATNTTGVVSLSVNHDQAALMFEVEKIPSEPKLSSEEYVPPAPTEPHMCSPGAIISMECDNKDAIPPSQS